jgi:hypothetical protein
VVFIVEEHWSTEFLWANAADSTTVRSTGPTTVRSAVSTTVRPTGSTTVRSADSTTVFHASV